MDILYLISILMFAFLIFLLVYFFQSKQRQKKFPENEEILVSFNSKISKGFAIGLVERKFYSENRIGFEISPRDINYIKELKNNKLISKLKNKDFKFSTKTIKVFFDKKFVIQNTGISGHRNIIFAFPQKKENLPEQFKENIFGKAIMKIINDKTMEKDEENLDKLRMKNLKKINEQSYGGEIFTDFMKSSKELLKDKGEFVKVEKEVRKDE